MFANASFGDVPVGRHVAAFFVVERHTDELVLFFGKALVESGHQRFCRCLDKFVRRLDLEAGKGAKGRKSHG